MREYTECYVAFLDILGFKNLIDKANFEEIHEIFKAITNFKPNQLTKKTNVYSEIKVTVMSDSIIVYIDASITDGFIALADVCSQIQFNLLNRAIPIFLRGGIAKGTLYHDGNILFGQGLTKAYTLENSLAVYPRIIFTEETREQALKNTDYLYIFDYNSGYYSLDNDGVYYINCFQTFNFIPIYKPVNVEEILSFENNFFEKIYCYVNSVLSKEINPSIRAKYLWLKRKICEQIECTPEVKKYFDEIEKEKRETSIKRFDDALKRGAERNGNK